VKRFPRLSRSTSNLSDPINRRLNMYALAAGAAGVGVLASAHPAEAKIVYTPSNIPITVNGALVDIDLNHDGINDFQFYAGYQGPGLRRRGSPPPEGNHASNLLVAPAQASNRVWGVQSHGILCAAALPKGTKVGPHRPFQPGHSSLIMAFASGDSTGGTAFGPWLRVKQAYLGLKFVIKGKVHFGWARIQMVGGSVGFPADITGYAYETIPNKPIFTGKTKGPDDASVAGRNAALTTPTRKPASLGLLAMGAPALSIWRREESVGNTQ
jgi:hypothetical protein